MPNLTHRPDASINYSGEIFYHNYIDTTGTSGYGGALYVSVQTGVSSYEDRPMINKIVSGSNNIAITPDSYDPGKVTITYNASSGGGDIMFNRITFPKQTTGGTSSNKIGSDGKSYVSFQGNVSGFLYRAYTINNNPISVNVYTYSNQNYIVIDFGSYNNFYEINDTVIVDVLVATSGPTTLSGTKIPPAVNG